MCPHVPLSAALALALFAAACSPEAGEGPAPSAPAAAAPVDSRLTAAIRALEEGRPADARAAALALGGEHALFGSLLLARAALLEGDVVGALRAVEDARETHPGDVRVHATAAEIYAASGKAEAAVGEIREGYAAGGGAPLERARGVLALALPGGAEEALGHLERARNMDPGLPFLRWPLVQAHLLIGREALSTEDALGALGHADEALGLDAGEGDAHELRADALAALGRFEQALELYAALDGPARDLSATRASLHHRAATARLLARDRPAAVEHYLAARELGLEGEGLGFGASVLAEEAERARAEGVARYEQDDLAGAEARFREALRLAPGDLVARNHLGVVHFRAERFAAAAEAWGVVWEAVLRGAPAPEPVHLNLARALRLAGDPPGAAAVVRSFLAVADERGWGAWRVESLDLLARLEEEAPAEPR